ncbi:MAG: hypothetical protein AAFQ82_03380 [Myxococcota bacterium]
MLQAVLLTLALVSSPSEPKILVMGWSVGSGIELSHEMLDEILVDAVRRHSPGIQVTGFREVEALLDLEQARDLIGCDDVSCSAEIGLALQTERVVLGTIGRIGGRVHLALKVVDARSSKIVRRVNASTRTLERLPALVQRTAGWMLRSEDARAFAPGARSRFGAEATLTRRREIRTGRVTQRWVTIDPEPPKPFRTAR